MRELKFTCPSCGQHIQCDWRHAGENVPCPGCATLIRVPLDGDVTDVPSPPPPPPPLPSEDNPFLPVSGDAEKVSYISAKPATGTERPKSPALPATPKQEPPVLTRTAQTSELHCVCPVCQSALRILMEPEPSPAGKPPTPGTELLPPNERERQIAAGRERSLHSTEKPHLDRILGDRPADPFSK